MKSRIQILVILLSSVTASIATDATNQLAAAQSDYKVIVYYDRMLPVSQKVAQKIQTDVLEMMKTANYNSRAPLRGWHQTTVPELTTGYRNVITSGKYVLVTWAHPQKVQTVGGEVTTSETIVALEIPGSWMYNVDEEGRLIHIGKFSGPMMGWLDEFVKTLAKDSGASAPTDATSPRRSP